MSDKKSSIPRAFILALQVELENHPQGIGEYDLMSNLKSQGYFEFLSKPALPHELFRAHFFLFHSLYVLSKNLLEEKSHLLTIHTLNIKLLPYQAGENALQEDDKLKAYYLDFNNLENTSEEDVYDMLASFWNNYNKFESRDEALSELGLKDPVTDDVIKKEYRRLIMQHHPDRGGDTERLQKLNDVINSLLG
ncbi:MAG TPA: molecular chaperone DnaJ [Gammaproteobacteria bacterium]|nr:molecular chaperone DnaJ [Gammaproteobacteria bacterium]